MAFKENLAALVQPGLPGVKAATYAGATVYGHFWNEYTDPSGVESSAPRFGCPAANLPGVVHGSVLVIEGNTYKAVNVRADGYGWLYVRLELQP